MRSSLIYAFPRISLGRLNQGEWDERGMWYAWERKVHKVLVGKPEGERIMGRPRKTCKNGIRMDLGEIGRGCRVDPVGSG
jgi:hypothetical protein